MLAGLVAACGEKPQQPEPPVDPEPEKVAYYVGGDISLLQRYEDKGVSYFDDKGTKIADVLKYMKSDAVGWNAQRVRLFVNPAGKDPDGKKDPQVCQDLDYVARLGKRIKAEGFAFLLDFHYSDTWADPSNQWIPKDWASLNETQLQAKVYEYTKQCLQRLVSEGATPDFIQPGNEVSYGMLWTTVVDRKSQVNRCYSTSPESNWERFIGLLNQAAKACREVCPKAKIVLHTERSGQPSALKDLYNHLSGVDYDIIGLSYYPFWHNSLQTLSQSLTTLAASFPDKPVQIVETAYYYQWQPQVTYDFSSTWPVSPAGQAAYAKALVAELKKHDNVTALYWWFPEENGNGPDSSVLADWLNRGLWDDTSHKALPGLYVLKDFLDR
jgi:arabinogalactan endo-1,4-beta-galactosidase